MKIKEAKERLDNLKRIYDNAMKIHKCCLEGMAKSSVAEIEEVSQINMT